MSSNKVDVSSSRGAWPLSELIAQRREGKERRWVAYNHQDYQG
jgi:hypothetical protein